MSSLVDEGLDSEVRLAEGALVETMFRVSLIIEIDIRDIDMALGRILVGNSFR